MQTRLFLLSILLLVASGCATNPTQQQKIAADKRATNQCLSRHWLKVPYSMFDDDQHGGDCSKHHKAGCYDVPSGHPDIGAIIGQCQ